MAEALVEFRLEVVDVAGACAVVYAFGPFLAQQGEAHLNLVFVPIPPLLFLLVNRQVVAGRPRPRAGLVIGLLVVAQYPISSEILVGTVLVLGATVALGTAAELLHRRPLRPRHVAAAPTLGMAAGVAAALLA